ncbi:hypothetical protein NB636_06200 [Oxalobacter aliiformigenes]|uniref:hypothetical protein n=1 Tax=Oxalobacter aliiformigenes TaxID=2946593 RepID=UPI0022AF3C53|nr:hypothetical protein [Oxalobacter aliiformigenes]MCZ4065653.1 hypothetical protein [Oxalobacter aliiformigenes]WAV98333.1 hypothetical protein NB636_06200 [Oxalobacter aliiformigenes]
MDRIKGAGHVNNRFVSEDAQAGRPPTELTAEWFNNVQEELCAVIEKAGITLNENDQTQLYQAIVQIVQSAQSGFTHVALTEDNWPPVEDSDKYSCTISKTAATDTCVSVCDSTGNRLIVNIAETDEQIVLTALAPVAGYAVISGSGGNTVQTVIDPSEDDTDTDENEE